MNSACTCGKGSSFCFVHGPKAELKQSVRTVHKRGSNNCGERIESDDEVTFQWKRVNCARCILKGQSKIPKGLK